MSMKTTITVATLFGAAAGFITGVLGARIMFDRLNSEPRSLVAQDSLTVKDRAGRVRARLEANVSPTLELCDYQGKPRVKLSYYGEHSAFLSLGTAAVDKDQIMLLCNRDNNTLLSMSGSRSRLAMSGGGSNSVFLTASDDETGVSTLHGTEVQGWTSKGDASSRPQ